MEVMSVNQLESGLNTPTKRPRVEKIHSAFNEFRIELDAHYDRRERIVKISRDVTAMSKKLIFALHRITNKNPKVVFEEADQKLSELRALFEKLQKEVEGENFWRYQRSVSPGIEEYLEGITFYHYLLNGIIPPLSLCQKTLLPPSSITTSDATPPPYVHITPEEYLGGVSDLTGELMRLAIASVGSNLAAASATAVVVDEEEKSTPRDIESIGKLVREIKGEMDPLAGYTRWLPKKLVVLDQSLAKIEAASYALKIRGAEFESEPEVLAALAKSISSGGPGEIKRDDE